MGLEYTLEVSVPKPLLCRWANATNGTKKTALHVCTRAYIEPPNLLSLGSSTKLWPRPPPTTPDSVLEMRKVVISSSLVVVTSVSLRVLIQL